MNGGGVVALWAKLEPYKHKKNMFGSSSNIGAYLYFAL
jgi:hypothetical protein